MSPAFLRVRWMVAVARCWSWWWCRCQAMVSAPASVPSVVEAAAQVDDELDELSWCGVGAGVRAS